VTRYFHGTLDFGTEPLVAEGALDGFVVALWP
jgi:hypothetical protein